MIQEQGNENSEGDLDERLYDRIIEDNQMEQQIEDFREAMWTACEKSLETTKTRKTPGRLHNQQATTVLMLQLWGDLGFRISLSILSVCHHAPYANCRSTFWYIAAVQFGTLIRTFW